MIFCRLSFFVVASVTALDVSQINNIDSFKKTRSSNIKHSEKNGSSFKEIEGEDEEDKIADNLPDEKAQQEEEVKRIRRKMKTHILMKELEKRKMVLERKLLELYGLKEQQEFIAQMHRHLEEKMTEIDMLGGTLEKAKKTVEELEKKMDVNAGHMKQHLMMLEEQVSEFQCGKGNYTNNGMIEKRLKAAKPVELEYAEMQRINKELELEKRELTVKLVGAQARIISVSNMTQDKILGKIEEEMRILRHTNEDLSKEVEKLQRNRFNMVEELVYQRWLNACLGLKHRKIKHHQERPHGNDSSTSTESSSNSQRSVNSNKSGFVHSIKSWGRSSKDDFIAASSPDKSCRRSLFTRNGLIHRHSTSMVPSNRPKMVQESTESPDTLNFPRVRRVSFCDLVENLIPDAPKSDEDLTDDKEMCTEKSEQSSTLDGSPNCEAKFIGSPYVSCLEAIEKNSLNRGLGRRIESEELHSRKSNDFGCENQAETSIFQLVAAFLFFLFMLLVCLISC
ncbi:hypothetical protein Pint_16400 [Pistacia integerrima]|uniref:Uncharacterized protein n=1 Tax=Pistacia integerrima TaxID=434235 RepID=A0ACC0ZDN9_9ROSI|nr:hypothetical protein Pint_16400 [Pistacia integerrima]